MNLFRRIFSCPLAYLIALMFAGVSVSEQIAMAQESTNWPQWRGPDFRSISTESNLPVEFGADKNLIWKCPMPGEGGSSPVVWDGTTYVTSATADEKGIVLIAVGPDGKIAWEQILPGKNSNVRMDQANSASPSPITDGKHVWATSGAGGLCCFTTAGEKVWELDLQKEFGKFSIQFGMSTSPIMDDGKLYMQLIHGEMRSSDPGFGLVICLDGATGKLLWKQNRESDAVSENKHSYASPTIYRDGTISLLLTHGGDFVVAHSLDDGHEVWRCGGLNPKDNYNNFLRFVSSPAWEPGIIVVPSAKTGRVLALRPDGTGDITDQSASHHWTMLRGSPDVASPLIWDGLVYLFRENGVVACFDIKDGEQLWEERMLADRHRSTPVIADGHIFITGRDGKVTVLKTGREPKIVATSDLGETTTASPAISGGRIYIRTFDNLYCFGKPTE